MATVPTRAQNISPVRCVRERQPKLRIGPSRVDRGRRATCHKGSHVASRDSAPRHPAATCPPFHACSRPPPLPPLPPSSPSSHRMRCAHLLRERNMHRFSVRLPPPPPPSPSCSSSLSTHSFLPPPPRHLLFNFLPSLPSPLRPPLLLPPRPSAPFPPAPPHPPPWPSFPLRKCIGRRDVIKSPYWGNKAHARAVRFRVEQ